MDIQGGNSITGREWGEDGSILQNAKGGNSTRTKNKKQEKEKIRPIQRIKMVKTRSKAMIRNQNLEKKNQTQK